MQDIFFFTKEAIDTYFKDRVFAVTIVGRRRRAGESGLSRRECRRAIDESLLTSTARSPAASAGCASGAPLARTRRSTSASPPPAAPARAACLTATERRRLRRPPARALRRRRRVAKAA